jgi:hypothetical protein
MIHRWRYLDLLLSKLELVAGVIHGIKSGRENPPIAADEFNPNYALGMPSLHKGLTTRKLADVSLR